MRVCAVAVGVALEGVGTREERSLDSISTQQTTGALAIGGCCPTSRQAILRVHISFSRLIYERIRKYAISLEYHSFNEIK
jgi:hypothetical protein